jgi:hypothetical protein
MDNHHEYYKSLKLEYAKKQQLSNEKERLLMVVAYAFAEIESVGSRITEKKENNVPLHEVEAIKEN